MSGYTLVPKGRDVVTFKCATCGKRGQPEDAYNLTVSCCSEGCFDNAFKVFCKTGNYPHTKVMLELVKKYPVPSY